MVLTVAKSLPKDTRETVHIVAFTPKPLLIQLRLAAVGEQQVLIGERSKTAIHYVFKPQLGIWLKVFAKLTGRTPPDNHAWIVADDVPAFVKFEGPLYMAGPIWRIELTIPVGINRASSVPCPRPPLCQVYLSASVMPEGQSLASTDESFSHQYISTVS
jgi:hypothetical protein